MLPQWRCSPLLSAKVSRHVPVGKKTTLRAPRWRSSRASAPHSKTSPAAQRTGGPPTSGDQEDDGRPDLPRWQAIQRPQRVGYGRSAPKRALVQASAVALHDVRAGEPREALPPVQTLRRLRTSNLSLLPLRWLPRPRDASSGCDKNYYSGLEASPEARERFPFVVRLTEW